MELLFSFFLGLFLFQQEISKHDFFQNPAHILIGFHFNQVDDNGHKLEIKSTSQFLYSYVSNFVKLFGHFFSRMAI